MSGIPGFFPFNPYDPGALPVFLPYFFGYGPLINPYQSFFTPGLGGIFFGNPFGFGAQQNSQAGGFNPFASSFGSGFGSGFGSNPFGSGLFA